jgi:nucleoside transporter
VLGVLHLLGGIVLLAVPQFSGVPVAFVLLLLLYNLCFMPTLGLANSIAFHNIVDQEKHFPLIRVFGTIGWIAAGLFVSFALKLFMTGDSLPEQTSLPLYAAAVTSLLLGLYSFSLPHTPPPAAGEKVSARSILGVDALKALGSRPFYVFLGASLLICIPLAAYYNFTQLFLEATGFQNIAGTQTFGQMSEVIFMLLMPVFFVRLGVKWMLVAGMGAWVLRYGLFAMAAPNEVTWMIITGIVLHGICYDFFFVTGQIYVDKKSTPAIRGQAQGMLVLVTYGLGMLIGAQAAGNLYNRFLGSAGALTLDQWRQFWFVPAAFAAVVMVGFALLFKDRVDRSSTKPVDA